MKNERPVIGFAMTGSFCTMSSVMPVLKSLCDNDYSVIPIMSEMLYGTDTRFGMAEDFIKMVEEYTGTSIIHTVKDAEPIGPKKLLDALVVAPCTGNTLSKIANGITDSSVSMAVKAV
ncbi:MAG: flavoprotein [Eubacteriales bacterium]|nr:flavoprotein [Eubacteriales bacterium]